MKPPHARFFAWLRGEYGASRVEDCGVRGVDRSGAAHRLPNLSGFAHIGCVQERDGSVEEVGREVRVAQGHVDRGVAEQGLNTLDRRAASGELTGERVTEGVPAEGREPGGACECLQVMLRRAVGDQASIEREREAGCRASDGKKLGPGLGRIEGFEELPEPGSERRGCCGRFGHRPSLSPIGNDARAPCVASVLPEATRASCLRARRRPDAATRRIGTPRDSDSDVLALARASSTATWTTLRVRSRAARKHSRCIAPVTESTESARSPKCALRHSHGVGHGTAASWRLPPPPRSCSHPARRP